MIICSPVITIYPYYFFLRIRNSTTVNLTLGVCWGTGYGRGFYRTAINNNTRVFTADISSICGRCSYWATINSNIIARAVIAATNSGTMPRFSIYGTTINGNIIARAVIATTDSSTKLRFSIYKTTINGNIIARAVIAATDSSTIHRFSIYKTTINGNIIARAVIAATDSSTIHTTSF